MAQGANLKPRSRKTARPAPAPEAEPANPLPVDLPREMFSGPGLLALADLLPVMTAFLDCEERYRFVNKPLSEWLETPRREMIGRTMREIVGEKAYASRAPMLAAAMAGERQYFASIFDHPTRGPLAVQTDYVPWFNPVTHEVDGVVVVVADITESRATEKALRESEERFRRIANSAPIMMWVTRLDRVRDFVNDAYVAFSGLDREEARLLDWRTIIHPGDHDRIVEESIAGEASLERFTLEARYKRHDGEWRWLRSVSQPRFGPDGELIGFIGAATDITLAKEAELQLRHDVEERTRELALSEARFRSVFDTVLEVLVLMEPDGTVVEVNSKTASWRAVNTRDAIGRKIWDGPTFRMYAQHAATIRKAVKAAAAGKVFNRELRMEREGAPTAYLDVSVQPVRAPEGEIVYLLFEARDITDLKSAQEQLRQSQKMEALGQLTGGIAHDFNNLLTVVVGGLDIIAKRADEEKLRQYAENALAAAERGARLTGQLLAFSRVQRLEARPTHVAPLIQNMRPLLRNVLGPGIQKKFDLDEEMIPVMADPTQLEVAILNLAINARDAMPEGGVLTIATRIVRGSSDPDLNPGRYVELTISDTGTGMTEDVAARAFEPFFTTKEVGKGTGLGLSMVYGMARQSGGTARLDTAPGAGTAVKLYFRAAEAGPKAESASAAGETADSGARRKAASVLVIDDDPDVRGFIVATLEEQGYRVREASDGEQGLAILERGQADLIVLDFVMPGLSGAEVANRIRARRPQQRILFVSGYSETDAVKRVAPDAPLLAKPFRADALDKAVRGALTH